MVRIRVGSWPRRRRRPVRGPAWLRGRLRAARQHTGYPAARAVEAAPLPEPLAEVDAPEDVDLVFRLQRRLSFAAGGAFLLLTLAVPLLSIAWPPWYAVDRWGGVTPNFAAVAFLLPAAYVALAFLYRRRADVYEERLLGGREPGEAP